MKEQAPGTPELPEDIHEKIFELRPHVRTLVSAILGDFPLRVDEVTDQVITNAWERRHQLKEPETKCIGR